MRTIKELHPELNNSEPGNLILNCAYLACDVYNANHDKKYGYERIYESNPVSSGYFGACYIPTLNNPNHAIIAHRGTVPDFSSIIADISVAEEKSFKQLEDAVFFAENFASSIKAIFGDIPIYNTGHSLGGILSDAATKNSNQNISITFENPGSKNILKKFGYIPNATKSFRITQSHINIINTCNEQLAPISRLIHKPVIYNIPKGMLKAPFDIAINPFMNGFYLVQNTLSQHTIPEMIEHMKAKGVGVSEISPFGFNEGYSAYLDTQKNQLYWHNYFDYAFKQKEYGTEMPWEQFLNSGLAAVERSRSQIQIMEEEKSYIESPRSLGFFNVEKNKDEVIESQKSQCLIA